MWAGNARILVTATLGRTTDVLELNTYPSYQVRAIFEGYLIELRRLQPDIPWSPRGPLAEYTATRVRGSRQQLSPNTGTVT